MSDSDGFQDFGFDQGDENVGKKSQRFKGKEGESYRISFVWLPEKEDGTPDMDGDLQFTGCERHYVQGVGYFLHKGPEFARIAGGPPKQSVATILVVWPTDRKGRLNKDAFRRGEGWEVKPWVFSAERYGQLKQQHEQFKLTEYDLSLNCTDTQYQKMTFSLCKENLFRKLYENPKGEHIAKAILEDVAKAAEGIRGDMARDLSLDKIREKLGGSSSGPVDSGGGTAENVDGLLDNLLDDDDE